MLDLRKFGDPVWPKELMPIGIDGLTKESYEDWRTLVGDEIHHLHPEISEQWIYRHWTQSPLSFLAIPDLEWREEIWTPDQFLAEVRTWRGNEPLNPEFDYGVFHQFGTHPTAEALDNGAWDYAPIVLSTPEGFIDTIGEKVDARYLLVEGHQRRRYLNALVTRGAKLPPQRVFVLSIPIVNQ